MFQHLVLSIVWHMAVGGNSSLLQMMPLPSHASCTWRTHIIDTIEQSDDIFVRDEASCASVGPVKRQIAACLTIQLPQRRYCELPTTTYIHCPSPLHHSPEALTPATTACRLRKPVNILSRVQFSRKVSQATGASPTESRRGSKLPNATFHIQQPKIISVRHC